MPVSEHRPIASILIAARNEETTILDCLRAIDRGNCPAADWEVLIGNDQSSDQTGPIVAAFVASKPNYRLIDIPESPFGLRGKANVLAQLVQQARGKLLYFSDADTQVPVDWITSMSTAFSTDQVGIVTGITLPQGPRIFHKLQTIDWLYNLTLTHVISGVGVPVTAMGNNMVVSRKAYDAIGGYESLSFSVVEDYTLFRAIVTHGFTFQNLLDERVLARTKPINTLTPFLQQRKRWMRGASDLPAWMVISLYSQYLAGPVLLLLSFFMPVLAVGLYLTKVFVQTLVISFGLGRLRQTNLWPYALLFEIYQLVIGPLSVLFYWLPTPIKWKGRSYK